MNKLIFNTIAEAIDYSKRNYSGKNIIRDLTTEKILGGSSSTASFKNPPLYVITSIELSHKLSNEVSKPVNKSKFKFTKTLTGFDQL